MKTTDELSALVEAALNARGKASTGGGGYLEATNASADLKHALTSTLAEKDARIAELEAHVKDLMDDTPESSGTKSITGDDRRRFVDKTAIQLFQGWVYRHVDEDAEPHDVTAKWAYDAAEVLATERGRRMQG